MHFRTFGALVALALLIVAQPAAAQPTDPFEAANRRIQAFDRNIHAKLLGPLCVGYPWPEIRDKDH
jgi:hypothetical protein